MKKNRPLKLPGLSGTAAAIAAAKELNPEDLKKILEEKTPPSPEQERASTIQALLSLAEQMQGTQLQGFVQTHREALRELEILNLKRNVSGVQLDKAELDGILLVLDALPKEQKVDLTTRIQQAAVAAGLPQQQLHMFASKLTRLGLHL